MLTRGDATWMPDLAEHQIVDRVNTDLTSQERRGETFDYEGGGRTELVYEYAQTPGVLADAEWPSRNTPPPDPWTTRTCITDAVNSYTEGGLNIAEIKADLKSYGPLAVDVLSEYLGTSVNSLPIKQTRRPTTWR